MKVPMKLLKRCALVSVVGLLAFGSGGFSREGRAQTKGPVIYFCWAQDRIRQGEDWKIYLSATNPDADMTRIYCRIDQPAGQVYRPDMVSVKKGMERNLNGYLVLRTYSQQNFFGVTLTLTVIIADRAGNESKPAVFPLSFNGESAKFPPSDKVPADLAKELNQRIGYIGIDLMRREQMGGG